MAGYNYNPTANNNRHATRTMNRFTSFFQGLMSRVSKDPDKAKAYMESQQSKEQEPPKEPGIFARGLTAIKTGETDYQRRQREAEEKQAVADEQQKVQDRASALKAYGLTEQDATEVSTKDIPALASRLGKEKKAEPTESDMKVIRFLEKSSGLDLTGIDNVADAKAVVQESRFKIERERQDAYRMASTEKDKNKLIRDEKDDIKSVIRSIGSGPAGFELQNANDLIGLLGYDFKVTKDKNYKMQINGKDTFKFYKEDLDKLVSEKLGQTNEQVSSEKTEYKTAEEVREAMRSGKITREQAREILKNQFGWK